MLDRYVDRPNREFQQGKYAMLDNMCYASFCAHYTLDTKLGVNAENDWQPVVLDDGVNEIRTVPKVLRYYTPSQHINHLKNLHITCLCCFTHFDQKKMI